MVPHLHCLAFGLTFGAAVTGWLEAVILAVYTESLMDALVTQKTRAHFFSPLQPFHTSVTQLALMVYTSASEVRIRPTKSKKTCTNNPKFHLKKGGELRKSAQTESPAHPVSSEKGCGNK